MSERPTQNKYNCAGCRMLAIIDGSHHCAAPSCPRVPPDEANSSHAQDVEEQEVLKLAKESGVHGWNIENGKRILEFAAKLRAVDTTEIASLKAQLSTEQGKIAILKDQYRSLQRSHHVLVTHHLAVEAQLAEAQKVPEGWKWVPNVTTKEMRIAGQEILPSEIPGRADYAATVYRAMLSAAPTYKKED